MAYPKKIATCCHCGTKAVLVLRGGRHELSCRSCGAPLRSLKRLPVARPQAPAVSHQPAPRSFETGQGASERAGERKPRHTKPRRRRPARFRKIKRWMKWAIEEVVDELEDLFD